MERRIGEVFRHKNISYKIVEDKNIAGCDKCALNVYKHCGEIGGRCCPSMREDKQFVIAIECDHE